MVVVLAALGLASCLMSPAGADDAAGEVGNKRTATCQVEATCLLQNAFSAVGLADPPLASPPEPAMDDRKPRSGRRFKHGERAAVYRADGPRKRRPVAAKPAAAREKAVASQRSAPSPLDPTPPDRSRASTATAPPDGAQKAAPANPVLAVSMIPPGHPMAKPREPAPALVAARLDTPSFHLLTKAACASPTTSSFMRSLPSAPIRSAGTVAIHSADRSIPHATGSLHGGLLSDRFSGRMAAAVPIPNTFVPPSE